MGLWPRTEAPCALDIAESLRGSRFLRVSPIGFLPDGTPDPIWLWVTTERLLVSLGRFAEGTDIGDEYATEEQATACWQALAATVGDDVHRYRDAMCPCWGCR